MGRILLAGVSGGIAVFIWSAFSHMVLPLGEAGLKTLPNEAPVLEALRANIPESGLYLYPGMDMRDHSKAAQEEWTRKYRIGPAGILVYRPVGGEPFAVRQFIVELVSSILAGLAIAAVIARVRGSALRRGVSGGLLGLFAWLSLSVSYWNWYGFPGSFILAEGIDQTVGWLLGGLVISRLAVPRRTL